MKLRASTKNNQYCNEDLVPSLPTDHHAVSSAVAPDLAPAPGPCPAPGLAASPDLAPGPSPAQPPPRGTGIELQFSHPYTFFSVMWHWRKTFLFMHVVLKTVKFNWSKWITCLNWFSRLLHHQCSLFPVFIPDYSLLCSNWDFQIVQLSVSTIFVPCI